MRISDWSSDVCSSDLLANVPLTLPTESLMNGLSTRTPENSSNPTSIDKKMTTSRIVGSHAFSSSRTALTRVNVTNGTIRKEAALIVAEGPIDQGSHTASTCRTPRGTYRPGSAVQMPGGQGTSGN